MFNHSTQDQNVVWERDTERLIITYRALRDIPVGEELCKSKHNIRPIVSDKSRHFVWKPSYFQGRRRTTAATTRGRGAGIVQLDSNRLSIGTGQDIVRANSTNASESPTQGRLAGSDKNPTKRHQDEERLLLMMSRTQVRWVSRSAAWLLLVWLLRSCCPLLHS